MVKEEIVTNFILPKEKRTQFLMNLSMRASQLVPVVKNPPAIAGDSRDAVRSSNPWVGKTPWRREWQPTPVFLPGKSHGQRSLVDYSPWGCNESDRTEHSTVYEAAYLTYTNF